MREPSPPGGAAPDALTAELFVPRLVPADATSRQAPLVERTRRLEAAGVVDELAVHDRRGPTGSTDDEFLLDRLSAFESWARRNDMAIGSFFARDVVRSAVTGDRRERPVFPPVALAEWHGDDLAFVSPCTDGGTVYTVPDRLDRLAGHRSAVRAPSTEP